MQQFSLDLDDKETVRPTQPMDPQQKKQVLELMAEAIVAVLRGDPGDDHEPA